MSGVGQNTERQEHQLTGFKLHRCFTESVSAKDTNRPMLHEMMQYVREGDTLLVHSMGTGCGGTLLSIYLFSSLFPS